MENRALAPQPDISLRSLADIETFRQASVAFSDRLPFRDRIIRDRNRLTYELLGDCPVAQVWWGRIAGCSCATTCSPAPSRHAGGGRAWASTSCAPASR